MRSMLPKLAIVAACAVFAATGGLEAQEGFTVNLDVACEDSELRALTRSFFSRELRELGDVRLGEAAMAEFKVAAIAVRAGRHGWYMSAVVTQLLDRDSVPGLGEEAATELHAYGRTVEHRVLRGDSSEDLGREIRLLAVAFNTDVLKPLRKDRKKR